MVLWRPIRPFRTNTQKRCPFHYRGLESKGRKSRNTWSNRQIWPWSTKWSRTKANRVCQEKTMVIAHTLFQQHKRRLYTGTSPDGQHWNQIDYILCCQIWKSSIQSAKTRLGADCGSDHALLIAKFRLKLKKVGKTTRPFRYAAAAKSLQSCETLCDPIDGSTLGSPILGILQARTLEWIAISFSNAWKWKVKVKSLCHVQFLATPWTAAYQAPLSMGFSRQEYWSGWPLPSQIQVWPNQIPYDYTVEVRSRFKGLDLIDRLPDELWMEVHDIVQKTGIKTISKKKKC